MDPGTMISPVESGFPFKDSTFPIPGKSPKNISRSQTQDVVNLATWLASARMTRFLWDRETPMQGKLVPHFLCHILSAHLTNAEI